MDWKKKLTTCTAFIVLATSIAYVINKFIYLIATISNFLGKRKGTYYEWRFGQIFYTKQGKGSPILLIHDLNVCSSGYEWNKITDKLAKTNTVYTLDLIGCGKSDKPNITYTNYLYVQLITDFIKHIIGTETDVVTTGISSSFVLMACKNEKNIIRNIMLINPTSISYLAKIPTKRTKMLKFLISIPIIGTLLYNILHSKENIEQTCANEYFYNFRLINDDIVKIYHESAHTSKMESKYLFASMKGLYVNANIIECLKELDNSIFIVTGNETPAYHETALQYQYYTPAIEIVGIDHTKYLPQLEAPEKVLEQIKLFFEIES